MIVSPYHGRFTREQVWAVVADVEAYPEFVPFCVGCRIVSSYDLTEEEANWLTNHMGASLIFAETSVGFKAFNERYISRIKLIPGRVVEAYSTDARLFEVLQSLWEFEEPEGRPDSCEITFSAQFKFKSSLYANVASYFLDYVSEKNVDAFIARIYQVCGDQS